MKEKLHWHPAFVQAMQLELFEYLDILEFKHEHQLTAQPLQIDLVIIKKTRSVVLDKNIARIFKKENILEYKSPDDHLSVKDFCKVYAYANLYAAITPDADLSEIKLTFVSNRYPQKLIRYLCKIRGYTVTESAPGIYLILGDYLPIQIIETKRLSEGENLWLGSLRSGLRPRAVRTILQSGEKQGRGDYLPAYLNILMRANPDTFLEGLNMAKKYPTIDEIWERSGMRPMWEEHILAKGMAQGRAAEREQANERFVRNLLTEGMPIDKIAHLAELPVEQVRALMEKQNM